MSGLFSRTGRWTGTALLFGTLLPRAVASAPVQEHTIDPETGLEGWRVEAPPLQLELIQRLPDQTRGFFIARGFTPEQAETIAGACVFQTIVRNTDPAGKNSAVEVDLGEWRVIGADGGAREIPVKEQWLRLWDERGVTRAARIAFEWSTFPTRQIYHPGDYNWGMTTLGTPPGTVLDLEIRWRVDGVPHRFRLPSLRCAPEEIGPPPRTTTRDASDSP